MSAQPNLLPFRAPSAPQSLVESVRGMTAVSVVRSCHVAIPTLKLQIRRKSELDNPAVPSCTSETSPFVRTSFMHSATQVGGAVFVPVADGKKPWIIDPATGATVPIVLEYLAAQFFPIRSLTVLIFPALRDSPVWSHLDLAAPAQRSHDRLCSALQAKPFCDPFLVVFRLTLSASIAPRFIGTRTSTVMTQPSLPSLPVTLFAFFATICHA